MTSDYGNEILRAFDETFLSLTGGEPAEQPNTDAEIMQFPAEDIAAESDKVTELQNKLDKIRAAAARLSTERYINGNSPEILLANLIDIILCEMDGTENEGNDFFELLNKERTVGLDDALTEFDFYKNNPYKTKAEKILTKIESKKNKRC
jgi:organic radical activating enzyme